MANQDSIEKSVLYVGHCYYNTWYLSRELRKLGWKADTLNFDLNPASQIYYHGEDFRWHRSDHPAEHILFLLDSLKKYRVFHFSNAYGLYFVNAFDASTPFRHPVAQRISLILIDLLLLIGYRLAGTRNRERFARLIFKMLELMAKKGFLPQRWDIKLLKRRKKVIVYTNNGCLDGVSQTSFSKWPTEEGRPVCAICVWQDNPEICCDEKNLAWGKLRNSLADYQCLLGGNRVDYNVDPRIHEVPEFYCLDRNFWHPNLKIPEKYKIVKGKKILLYHAVGHAEARTKKGTNENIKSTHIFIPLIERLKSEGYNIDLVHATGIPSTEVKYIMAQAEIVLDMLSYGFFGANIREAMMLGIPSICYLRPLWLEQMRAEIPDYVAELPVISANPTNVYRVLKDLLDHPVKRVAAGQASRRFAEKWHASDSAAIKFSRIYGELLEKRENGHGKDIKG